eukprot:CAMPEP_0119121900 /NCGR_PEP_ID=MMETSP1310-20130426/2318_1 /TAXON_ID=464262 /ORGANISM="Genus nov. species nov., Strain RCC2339" /LENGTH=298 /DNA_ID=CAMNT_0007111489 /DNA_START=94 /DNA_END=987 /DNA_ORIENTATION=+
MKGVMARMVAGRGLHGRTYGARARMGLTVQTEMVEGDMAAEVLDCRYWMAALGENKKTNEDDSDIESDQSSSAIGSKLSILLTCEHATNHLPRPYDWRDDRWIKHTHWASDPGAADLTRDLSETLQCVSVLARFSRLLVDANRPLASDTLMREQADGVVVHMNTALPKADRDWRLWRYYIPYHMTLGEVADQCDPRLIIAIHSFNPVYEGRVRKEEIGVLASSSEEEIWAEKYAEYLCSHGYNAVLNAPWSGHDGFMYAPDCLKVSGSPGRRKSLMFEVRNDLLTDSRWRKRLVEIMA